MLSSEMQGKIMYFGFCSFSIHKGSFIWHRVSNLNLLSSHSFYSTLLPFLSVSDPYRKEPGRVFGVFLNCVLEKLEMGDESRIKLGSVLVMIISFKILFLCIKEKLNIGLLCIQHTFN